MAFFDEPPRYYTFLLTVREERSQDTNSPGVWRFRLEDTLTDQRHGFASLDSLIAFLQASLTEFGRTSQSANPDQKAEGGRSTR